MPCLAAFTHLIFPGRFKIVELSFLFGHGSRMIGEYGIRVLEVERTGLYADEVERIGKPATYRRLGH